MNLPSKKQCFKLLEKYGMNEFPNIYEHIKTVNKIAVFLAKKLKQSKENINIELVDRASLLHDIAKPLEIKNRNRKSDASHAQLGFEILVREGYPEVAEVVKKHRLDFWKTGKLKAWEEKLIYYSDCRVHDKNIVSLEERIKGLKERYKIFPGATNKIQESYPFVKKLEEQIFLKINIKPENLKQEIKKSL